MLALDERRLIAPAARSHSPGRTGAVNSALAALGDNALGARFRAWRGASGRRYVFSIYSPDDRPAYEDAVLIVAARDGAGERSALSIADTGCFPELVLARAGQGAPANAEFHIHVLAKTAEARRALIADLAGTAAGVGDADCMARRPLIADGAGVADAGYRGRRS